MIIIIIITRKLFQFSAPPKSDPEISGVHDVVSLGDTVNCNCTSFRSKPVAGLMFYINDEKVSTLPI